MADSLANLATLSSKLKDSLLRLVCVRRQSGRLLLCKWGSDQLMDRSINIYGALTMCQAQELGSWESRTR